jgi:hypothetical protein
MAKTSQNPIAVADSFEKEPPTSDDCQTDERFPDMPQQMDLIDSLFTDKPVAEASFT